MAALKRQGGIDKLRRHRGIGNGRCRMLHKAGMNSDLNGDSAAGTATPLTALAWRATGCGGFFKEEDGE